MTTTTNDLLHVRIVSSRKVLFENQATMVSSVNNLGIFDILPGHANFITLVENSPIKIELTTKNIVTLNVAFAVIYNSNNRVNIYIDILPHHQEFSKSLKN